MKRKSSTPLRPKRSRSVSVGGDRAPEPGTVLSSDAPPNSDTVPDSTSLIRHLRMSRHSHNLLKFLDEDRSRGKFCDVSVSVGGTIYRAHKVVLAHGSSYFHAELSKNPAMTNVTLDHVEDSVFQHLLDFLYTSECVVTDRDLPALIEAARFLDMMDILKMLCKEGEVHPVSVIQAQAEIGVSSEVEMTSSDSPAGNADIQSPLEQSNLCNRQLDAEHSVQNHLAESHGDVQQETPTEGEKAEGQRTVLTRRSARRRRTPTKYKRDDVEYSVNTPEETQKILSPSERHKARVEEAGNAVVEKQTSKPSLKETSKPALDDDVVDEEDEGEEGGDVNEDVAADKSASQQGPDGEGSECPGAREVEVQAPAAGSSNQSPVYPEGLAPVIIQTSSKKILMCPKCDKTFDRAGGKHRIRSPFLVLWFMPNIYQNTFLFSAFSSFLLFKKYKYV